MDKEEIIRDELPDWELTKISWIVKAETEEITDPDAPVAEGRLPI